MTAREIERVESLLRERAAELQRTHLRRRHPEPEPEDVPIGHWTDTPAPLDLPPRRATCADCGGTIPPSRLKAVPGTVRCVSCQRAFEVRLA